MIQNGCGAPRGRSHTRQGIGIQGRSQRRPGRGRARPCSATTKSNRYAPRPPTLASGRHLPLRARDSRPRGSSPRATRSTPPVRACSSTQTRTPTRRRGSDRPARSEYPPSWLGSQPCASSDCSPSRPCLATSGAHRATSRHRHRVQARAARLTAHSTQPKATSTRQIQTHGAPRDGARRARTILPPGHDTDHAVAAADLDDSREFHDELGALHRRELDAARLDLPGAGTDHGHPRQFVEHPERHDRRLSHHPLQPAAGPRRPARPLTQRKDPR